MSDLSKVVVTDEAIVIQKKKSNSQSLEKYAETQARLTESYRKSLELDAQLVRSETLRTQGKVISTEEALSEASRQELSQIVYFTSLQEKVKSSRSNLFGSSNG